MRNYETELEALRERIARHRENLRVLEQLTQQEKDYRQRQWDCQWQYEKEQADVDRLERLSWSSLWAAVRGSKEEDLDREKAEAWAARVKWQEAQRQLEEIQREIADRRARQDGRCEAEYQALLDEKEAAYRQKDPAFAARLADMERRELALTTQRRELNEALAAGRQAESRLDAALEKLGAAQSWSTWDLMGGGIIADMAKYGNLDEAQRLMEGLQSDLRRYQTELTDVAQATSWSFQPDSFTWAMDVWFDNFFADWAVRNQIRDAQCQLEEVACRVRQTQQRLEERLEGVRQSMEQLGREREEAVRRA